MPITQDEFESTRVKPEPTRSQLYEIALRKIRSDFEIEAYLLPGMVLQKGTALEPRRPGDLEWGKQGCDATDRADIQTAGDLIDFEEKRLS